MKKSTNTAAKKNQINPRTVKGP